MNSYWRLRWFLKILPNIREYSSSFVKPNEMLIIELKLQCCHNCDWLTKNDRCQCVFVWTGSLITETKRYRILGKLVFTCIWDVKRKSNTITFHLIRARHYTPLSCLLIHCDVPVINY